MFPNQGQGKEEAGAIIHSGSWTAEKVSNAFYSKGVSIRHKNLTWSSYIVKTQEFIYSEEDISKTIQIQSFKAMATAQVLIGFILFICMRQANLNERVDFLIHQVVYY